MSIDPFTLDLIGNVTFVRAGPGRYRLWQRGCASHLPEAIKMMAFPKLSTSTPIKTRQLKGGGRVGIGGITLLAERAICRR